MKSNEPKVASGAVPIQVSGRPNGTALYAKSINTLAEEGLNWLRLIYHNTPYWVLGAPDYLPIPPTRLRALIWGPTADLRTFFKSEDNWRRIPKLIELLTDHGVKVDQLQAILDFGCGCGRDIRQFFRLKNLVRAKVYGTDINAEQISWCRRNLTFADFSMNGPEPPLTYNTGQFDLIYNYSVFTHLSESQQKSWMQELSRVLRPGGYLMLTVCGDSYLHELNETQVEQYRAGYLIVRNADLAGIPADYGKCAAYHPQAYVTDKLATDFEVVRLLPGVATIPGSMDQYLLKKLSN